MDATRPDTERAPEGEAPGALAAGALVEGRYRVEGPVGSGGAGTVYAARDERDDRPVALKVLRLGAEGESASAAARLARAARAANEIDHPAVVPVEGSGRLADGRPYLVMPLLKGRSLRDVLARDGALPAPRAWRIAREVALALDAAHVRGIVHRDLKPDNVFLEDGPGGAERVRLLDFGLAKVERPHAEQGDEAGLVRALTRSEVTVGTPAYMAPEQWWNAGVGPATDQYALGVVLYEMLAARPPFAATSIAEVVQAHLHASPASLDEGVAPPGLSDLILRALAKDPEARFPALRELVAAGDAILGAPPPIEPAPTGRAPMDPAPTDPAVAARASWSPWRAHLASLALGVGLALAVGYAGDARHDPRAWLVLGGAPQFVTALVFLLAALALPRLVRRSRSAAAPLIVALAPGALGELGTFTDWAAVRANLSRFPDRLAAVHEGMYEANLARFLGNAASAILLAALAVALAPRPIPRVRLALASSLFLLGAASASVLGAPAILLVAASLAVSILASTPDRGSRGSLAPVRLVVSVLGVAFAFAVAFARIEARQAYLWTTGAPRAARLGEILGASVESRHTALACLALLALALYPSIGLARVAFAARASLGRAARLALGVAALGVALDVGLRVEVARVVAGVRGALEAEFTLYAHLDPPSGGALDPARHRPHPAAAVQIARGAIAVNGKGVAPLAALRSTEGSLVVAAELSRVLAAEVVADQVTTTDDARRAELQGASSVASHLALVIDREVPYADVRRVLDIAYGAGVRRVELLLSRGGPVSIPQGAPDEASYVTSGDFVAVGFDLAEDGLDFDRKARFDDVAPRLIAATEHAGDAARLAAGR